MKTILATIGIALIALCANVANGAVHSITSLETAFTEDFDTLANTGTSSALPTGWALAESGSSGNNNGLYTAGTGSSTTGDTYSFGATSDPDRALGGLRSGTLVPLFGVQIQNDTGTTISGLTISYFGEQWRLGVLDRGAPDRLDFQFSTDATSLTTGSWTDANAFNFNSPITTGTARALDGNDAANRTLISDSLSGLSVVNGNSIWFRWMDFDITSSDDGLGIDDFSITAVPEPAEWGLICAVGLLGVCGLHTWRERRRSQRQLS